MKSATATDWRTSPLPDARSLVVLNRPFSAKDLRRIRKGLIPEQMEDKWFIYWQDSTLFMHRSWTGYCVYEISFSVVAEDIHATEVRVNRDPEQYTGTGDEHDAKMALYLVDALLLRRDVEFPCDEPSGEQAA